MSTQPSSTTTTTTTTSSFPTNTTSSNSPSSPLTPPTPSNPPLRPIFLTLLLACPVLMLLPPRKLDLYTFSLAGAWVVSAEELAFGSAAGAGVRGRGRVGVEAGVEGGVGYERGNRIEGVEGIAMAMGGREKQGALDWNKKAKEEIENIQSNIPEKAATASASDSDSEEAGILGLAKKLWMGSERPGWQKRRLEREREELEAGKGYGDIIMGQVREVFPRFGGGGRERGDGEGEGEGGGEER